MRRRLLPIFVLALFAACADADPMAPRLEPADATAAALASQPVTVLSRNLYLGAEIASILTATSALEVAQRAGASWQQVLDSDVPGRAAAWADEIEAARPHLVGLQEAATFWRQAPGDFLGGNPSPAVDLEFDFVALLLAELAARGTPYNVVAAGDAMHIELPMLRGTEFEDIRMLLRDVILARADVDTRDARTGSYVTKLNISVAGLPLSIPRGWASVDATVAGRDVHFVTTHLEAFHPLVQEAQAVELTAVLADRSRPTVLVGDLNSRADGSGTGSYAIVTGAGFADAWTAANGDAAGYTCCQASDLRNAESQLSHRIDFVLVRDAFWQSQPPIVGDVRAWLVGEEPADRLPGGLWPSDHAGVAAALRLPQSPSQ